MIYSVADRVEEVSEEETYRDPKAIQRRMNMTMRGSSDYGMRDVRRRAPARLILKREFRKTKQGTVINMDSTHIPLVKHFRPLRPLGKQELSKGPDSRIDMNSKAAGVALEDEKQHGQKPEGLISNEHETKIIDNEAKPLQEEAILGVEDHKIENNAAEGQSVQSPPSPGRYGPIPSSSAVFSVSSQRSVD